MGPLTAQQQAALQAAECAIKSALTHYRDLALSAGVRVDLADLLWRLDRSLPSTLYRPIGPEPESPSFPRRCLECGSIGIPRWCLTPQGDAWYCDNCQPDAQQSVECQVSSPTASVVVNASSSDPDSSPSPVRSLIPLTDPPTPRTQLADQAQRMTLSSSSLSDHKDEEEVAMALCGPNDTD
ncbi:hypothetical protein OC834_005820 [Tilletia horrida]|uniref:Uncharacterized protein n=1 Tax=Tilletia horrida TaxID=155126 RepID=A0AAN6JI58_9BASI|nr:hypothetical protein OC834_005820 [Tilletia horrida]KAK0524566.1 hypothetical protein OC842_005795 [Tilletia horrida]